MNIEKMIEKEVANLPDTAQAELLDFIRYLRFKYATEKRNATLRGIWQDIPFDIEQDDIRNLRQE